MRPFAVMLAIASTCLGGLGQGKVMFGNDSNHLFVLSVSLPGDVSGPIPVSPLPSGKSLMAVLYAGTSSASLSLQTSVVLNASGWLTNGRMVSKPVVLTGVPGGAAAYFQIFLTDTLAVLPAAIAGGYNYGFSGATYFGTSGLFTATPGTSISYPSLVPGGPSGSAWAAGPIDAAGCLSCGYFPRFAVNPTSQSVTVGSAVTLYALATSYADCCYPMGYAWRKNGGTITGANTLSLTITNVQIRDAGNYDVVAYNVYGVTTSSVATLTVLAPAIAATLGSPTYTSNNEFQFTVTGTAGSNYAVQAATNLSPTTTWMPLFTNASPFTFVDTNAQNSPRRFYRVYAQ